MKVLVFGDSCQDVHVYGKSERLCPDAPVPVLVSIEKQSADGMAGNVVKNLESLDRDWETNTFIHFCPI